MKPKTYCEFPRRCQNCRFVSMSMQTSFLRKRGSDKFHCTKNDPVPRYPDAKSSKDHPSWIGRISDDDKAIYDKLSRSWSKRTRVLADGSCHEHEFSKGA